MIELVQQIVVVQQTSCMYQFSSFFGTALLKLWMALKKTKSNKLMSGEFAACMRRSLLYLLFSTPCTILEFYLLYSLWSVKLATLFSATGGFLVRSM